MYKVSVAGGAGKRPVGLWWGVDRESMIREKAGKVSSEQTLS